MFKSFRIRKREKKKREKNTAGFTFVELLIAVAVFGICAAPLLSAFVMSTRLNTKGRQREQAMTVAQNLMEGIKGFGLAELAKQCSSSSTDFTIIPQNNVSGENSWKDITASTVGDPVYVGGSFVGHSTSTQSYTYTLLNGSTVTADVEVDITPYEFRLENILMGKNYYDAEITITQNLDENYVFAGSYESDFADVNMHSLRYYDVEIDVYIHPATNDAADQFTENALRATYTGTFLDKN